MDLPDKLEISTPCRVFLLQEKHRAFSRCPAAADSAFLQDSGWRIFVFLREEVIMKRLTFVFLALCLTLCIFGAASVSAAEIASGTCGAQGDNLTWVLTDDGTLTISGTGEMAGWDWNTVPWYSYSRSIKQVVIENGVTSIGNCAFWECANLRNITIPASVTSIINDPFFCCDNLISITVDGNNAKFCDLDGVLFTKDKTILLKYPASKAGTAYAIPAGVTSIGDNAFLASNNLISITIPDSTASIYGLAFQNCRSLVNFRIPASVTFVGEGAFLRCTSLTDITVDGSNANYCDVDGVLFSKDKTRLHTYPGGRTETQYVIPDGVTHIGSDAFTYCTNLVGVTIPASVIFIPNWSFDECPNLTIYGYTGSTAETYAKENNIPFQPLAEPVITVIASGTCGAQGDNLTWKLTSDGTLTISGTGAMADWVSYDATPWSNYKSSIKRVVIEKGVASIGGQAFSSCSTLTEFSIADTVLSIGEQAFDHCESLTSITLPQNLTSIGNSAFFCCGNLANVIIPDSVTTIGYHAFANCSAFTEITVPASVTSIGLSPFYQCTGLENVYVEDDSAYYCDIDGVLFTKDVSVLLTYPTAKTADRYVIPEGVAELAWEAFYGCSNLTEITLPDSLTTISANALGECTGLTGITVPDSVAFIGQYAFIGCTGLTDIIIPASVTDLISQAFWNCTNLADVTILNKNASIGTSVFHNCENLTIRGYADSTAEAYAKENNIPFISLGAAPAAVIASGTCGAQGDNLTWVLTDDGTLTISGTGAMADWSRQNYAPWYPYCQKIEHVVIEDGVTTIGANAFSDGVSTYGMAHSLGGGMGFGPREYYWNLKTVEIAATVTHIESFAFAWCESLTEVSIPASVKYISTDAFEHCASLTALTVAADNQYLSSHEGVLYNKEKTTLLYCPRGKAGTYGIPDSVTNINSYAFFGCKSLVSVVLPDSVFQIHAMAFETCSALASVNIPEGVSYIGEYAFFGTALTSVQIPAAAETVGRGAFACCPALTDISVAAGNPYYSSLNGVLFDKQQKVLIQYSVGRSGAYTLPASVVEIGWGAFAYAKALPSVTLQEGLKGIDASAFYFCSSLTDVTIPASVVNIGDNNFFYCEKLSKATILSASVKFGSGVFLVWNHEDLVLYGHAGSTAESYAAQYNIPFEVLDEPVITVIASGTCGAQGDNLTWVLTDDGTLTISGTGAMAEWTYSAPAPWYAHRDFIKTVVIENGVTTIASHAFYDCIYMEKASIPEGITSIGMYAFSRCSRLTSIDIPASVTNMGLGVFHKTQSLTSINVSPDNISYTSDNGVLFNKQRTELIKYPTGKTDNLYTIPDSVVTVAMYGFFGSDSLTGVVIGNNVAALGESSFVGSGIKTVFIPKNVTSIEHRAFAQCHELSSITVSLDNPNYSSDKNGVLFSKDGSVLMQYPIAKTDTSYTIPTSVSTIGGWAFETSRNLTKITLHENVAKIEKSAFVGCSMLENVTVLNPKTVFGDTVFNMNNTPNLVLYGYAGSTAESYAAKNNIPFEVLEAPAVPDVFLYTDAPAVAVQGSAFTYTVSLAGTYDGFSFDLYPVDGMTITQIESANGKINVDAFADHWMVSVLGGLDKVNAEKEVIVTVTVQVAADAALGTRTLALADVMISTADGGKAAVQYKFADIQVTDQIPGDIDGDGMFNYYDVAKLYAFYRGRITLDKWVITDVNGDGTFDYYDVSKIYAVYRGRSSFN